MSVPATAPVAEDIIRKICRNGTNKYVFLPSDWGVIGKYVRLEKINDKELKVILI